MCCWPGVIYVSPCTVKGGIPIIISVIYVNFLKTVLAVAKNEFPAEKEFIIHFDAIYEYFAFCNPIHVRAVICNELHYIETCLRYDTLWLHQKWRFIFDNVFFYIEIGIALAASLVVPAVEIYAACCCPEREIPSFQGFYLAFCHWDHEYGFCHVVKNLDIFLRGCLAVQTDLPLLPVFPGIIHGSGQRILHMFFIFKSRSHFDFYADHLLFETFRVVFPIVDKVEFIPVNHFYRDFHRGMLFLILFNGEPHIKQFAFAVKPEHPAFPVELGRGRGLDIEKVVEIPCTVRLSFRGSML